MGQLHGGWFSFKTTVTFSLPGLKVQLRYKQVNKQLLYIVLANFCPSFLSYKTFHSVQFLRVFLCLKDGICCPIQELLNKTNQNLQIYLV